MDQQTFLLIDGHSMAFRSFYAIKPDYFRTESGIYTNSVHGFMNTLLRLIKDYRPTHIAVAFDLSGVTFRKRMYPDYKEGRKPAPQEFKGQIDLIQKLLTTIGIKWLNYQDYEADDIIATLATRGENAGMKVIVASGDKDSFQLINDNISVAYPDRGKLLLLDPEAVEKRTGVPPRLYSDLAALVGEKADNIRGVSGVGNKTAAKWLKEYGSLQALLDSADTIKGKVAATLCREAEQVRLNRKLNQLVLDLPIGEDLADFLPCGVDAPEFAALCDLLEFTSVRKRVLEIIPIKETCRNTASADLKDAAAEASLSAPATEQAELKLRQMQILPADTKLADFLTAGLQDADVENQLNPWGIAIAGRYDPGRGKTERIAISNNYGQVFAFTLDKLEAADYNVLTQWLQDERVAKIGHKIKDLMHALAGNKLDFAPFTCCTELQAYLLQPEQRSYEFARLVEKYLDLPESDAQVQDTLGINADGTLSGTSSLEFNAVQVLNLADALNLRLREAKQNADLLRLEVELAHVLFKMEHRGIAVDLQRLAQLHAEFDAKVEQARYFAYAAIDDDTVNLLSPKQLQIVLFEKLSLPHTKKTKTGYTTNIEALTWLLEQIAEKEDENSVRGQNFLNALIAHRDAIKLRQFVEGLQKAVGADGRIHTNYQQTVASTGRLSSTEPNLQNIPARSAEGLQIREVFVPGADFTALMTADYSQIEMRLMVHLSGDQELIKAFNAGADLHKYVASQVYRISEDQVTSAQRSKIKAMSYGLVYGLSAYGLSEQLRISVNEAQKLMNDYFARFGRIKNYLQTLVDSARKNGYTQTIMGRRRYLPDLLSEHRQTRQAAERAALNAPIQGSAADVIKIAMLAVEAAIVAAGLKSRILLQIHDELIFEVAAGESEVLRELVEREMSNAYHLCVPLTVGIGIGSTWRAAAH